MYVLLSEISDSQTKMPDTVVAEAVSENKQSLIELLRQMAIDFVTPRYDNDEDYFAEILEEIDKATTYWCDEDDEYPYTLKIQEVKLI